MSAGGAPGGAAGPRAAATRLTLRLDFPGGARLGPGKARLLEAILSAGSISGAGRALGMSYRRAWLLVEALNATFDAPLVQAQPGGAGGGGAGLTPLGREVLERYRRLERAAIVAAAPDAAALEARLAAPGAEAPAAVGPNPGRASAPRPA